MTDKEMKELKKMLNLIELEMILRYDVSLILRDIIEMLAMYEQYKNKENR